MSDPEEKKTLSRVSFEYLKSPQFRSIHADGAIGSVTPRGLIHMALFSERPAIPRKLVFQRQEDGTLGAEVESERVVREGFIREMDVDVLLSVEVAESLVKWLQDRIEETHSKMNRRERN